MSAREELLFRVRSALADRPRDRSDLGLDHDRQLPVAHSAVAPDRSRQELTSRFMARVAEYRAGARRVPADEVAGAIERICSERGVDRLGVPVALPEAWVPVGLELAIDEEIGVAGLDRVDGALSGCRAAVAESGTIVLDGRGTCGRRVLTLLPDLHICIVEAARITAEMPEALASLDPAAPITLISGPSATSDIELSRVEGVHGPRQLEVLVLE